MSLVTSNDRIFVAGHRGMAGSAIVRALHAKGYQQVLTASRSDLDLLERRARVEHVGHDVVLERVDGRAERGAVAAVLAQASRDEDLRDALQEVERALRLRVVG